MISNRFGRHLSPRLVGKLSVSNRTEYIPVHAIYSIFEISRFSNSYIYNKISEVEYFSDTFRGYDKLLSRLFYNSGVQKYIFKIDDEEVNLAVSKGIIQEYDGTVLFCFGVKSESLFEGSDYKGNDAIKRENLKLFISTKFATDSKYRNVYKKLLKEVVHSCFLEGIEVSYMSSSKIDSILYNDGLEYSFNTITDAKEFLKNDVHKIFTFEEDLYNVFSEVSLE